MATRPVFRNALGAAGLMILAWESPVMATGGSNGAHRVKAFDLHAYAPFTDAATGSTSSWKSDYCSGCAYGSSNPWFSNSLYQTLVTNCNGGDACGHTSSVWQDDSSSLVTLFHNHVNNNNADLVIFMGHHASIREWNPPNETFDVWVPYDTATRSLSPIYNGYWTIVHTGPGLSLSMSDWGTSVLPYWYHARGTVRYTNDQGIYYAGYGTQTDPQPSSVCWYETYGNVYCTPTGTTSASSYGVQYMYNPVTSVLIGIDYVPGVWATENDNGVTSTQTVRQGRLGSGVSSTTPGVKWYIANGCQLVPVAWYAQGIPGGEVYASNKGRQQWSQSWDGAHIALGHYAYTTSTCLPNMVNVGNSLMGGVTVVDSYFDQHSSSVWYCHDPDEKGFGMPAALGPDGYILWYETWTSPWANPASNTGEWVSYYEVAE